MIPQVRPMGEFDVDATIRLWAACEGLGSGPGDDPASLSRFLRRNPDLSCVAVDDSELVGALLCGHDGRRGFMYRLAVHPDHRRRGLARMLVEAGLRLLAQADIPRAMVFVLADNTEALTFWEAVGAEARPELRILSLDIQ
jgi:ribosomal protein S18 acetylase RimI-like enzyme